MSFSVLFQKKLVCFIRAGFEFLNLLVLFRKVLKNVKSSKLQGAGCDHRCTISVAAPSGRCRSDSFLGGEE